MSASNFKTENNTYRKLMGNGLTYHIPRFQRDYSWTDEEWDDLWADVLGVLAADGESAHYMGYLVLQSVDEKSFNVIDGQQRLTTLSLLVLAVLKSLQRLVDDGTSADQNRRRLEQIRSTYVGYLDPVTLTTRSKLTLNRNNDRYFQTWLVPLARLPVRGFNASEHQLRKAFEWFDKQVQDYAQQHPSDAGVALASLVETMSDRIFFTVIHVTDELNAYKVFETLNARGVRLSSTDLLKNYLFSVLDQKNTHPHELTELEDRWESIVSRLGVDSLPDFLRSHWNSRNPLVRQSELFKTIRSHVKDREGVFNLLRGMEEDVDTYRAFTDPEGSHWKPALKADAQCLRMFRVRQPFPLLLAARRKLNDAKFSKVLRACVVIAFRYNVIGGLHTNVQERVYNEAAQKVVNGQADSDRALLDALRSIYIGDDAFKAAFAEKVLRTTDTRNNRVVRYILCELERQVSGLKPDFESDTFNIEHVLPHNPQQNWDQFNDSQAEESVFRLGNMTLLARSANNGIGNLPYTEKRKVFEKSTFQLTRKLAEENAQWTVERIAARQNAMSKIASTVWRIDYLS